MKIDYTKPILDLKGVPIKEDEQQDLTLGSVSCTALLATYPDEQSLDPKVKFRRFQLALSATSGGIQDLSVEDVAELKKLIGKAYGPLVVGRAYDIIEPPETNSV